MDTHKQCQFLPAYLACTVRCLRSISKVCSHTACDDHLAVLAVSQQWVGSTNCVEHTINVSGKDVAPVVFGGLLGLLHKDSRQVLQSNAVACYNRDVHVHEQTQHDKKYQGASAHTDMCCYNDTLMHGTSGMGHVLKTRPNQLHPCYCCC